MSRKKRKNRAGEAPKGGSGPERPEGWESLAEESEGTLAPNPELEEALREAADAVEALERDRGKGGKEEAAASEALEELSGRLVESQDRMLRLQADFENFRRRALKERQEILQYGYQNLVKDLLSTVDNLDRAIDHVSRGGGADFESLLKGVELVRKDLLGVLAKYEVNEIEALGKPFDPAHHEAMAQTADSSAPANTVVEVLQKGYLLRDRLLRPTRVVVSSEAEEKAAETAEQEQVEDEASD